MILLGKVKDVLGSSGRGMAVGPEFADSPLKLRVCEKIELRAPHGPTMATRIKGRAHTTPQRDCMPRFMGILLEDGRPVPDIGVEIWLVRDL